MAEKEEKKDKDEKKEPWHFKVVSGGEHPDNKPPVTIVSEASEEDAAKQEATVNAAIEKDRTKKTDIEALEAPPLKVQLVDAKKDADKDSESNNYEDKTVPELKEIAAKKGVELNWDDNKTEIIKKIKKAK